jgi:hypothetical protein
MLDKYLNNIGLKRRPIIGMPRAPECLIRPVET